MMTRRELLRAFGLTAVGGAVLPATAFTDRCDEDDPLDLVSRSSRIGDEFAVTLDLYRTIRLELVEVSRSWLSTPTRSRPTGRPVRHASLVFRQTDDGPALEQATYRLRHRNMKAFDLFIVPVDQGHHRHYQAVFCRLV